MMHSLHRFPLSQAFMAQSMFAKWQRKVEGHGLAGIDNHSKPPNREAYGVKASRPSASRACLPLSANAELPLN
jgi:hypothetical protein